MKSKNEGAKHFRERHADGKRLRALHWGKKTEKGETMSATSMERFVQYLKEASDKKYTRHRPNGGRCCQKRREIPRPSGGKPSHGGEVIL